MTRTVDRPVGVFDSGFGGVSILQGLMKHAPHESFLYVADSAHAPYGNRTEEYVIERTLKIASWFIEQKCKAVVVACNTATLLAIKYARSRYSDMIFVGVEPAVKPAAQISSNKKIGILATEQTVRSSHLRDLIEQYAQGTTVTLQSAPGLVERIEMGDTNSSTVASLLERYLEPMLAEGIDTLVLGCTHYIFLESLIKKIVGSGVTIVETSNAVAKHTKKTLQKNNLIQEKSDTFRKVSFFSSGADDEKQKVLSDLLGQDTVLKFVSL